MNRNNNKNNRINKQKTINVDRLEKTIDDLNNKDTILDEEEENVVEKSPIQKMFIYIYILVISIVVLIGCYIVYKYVFKKNNTLNKVGGSSHKVNLIPELDRKNITDMLNRFID